MHNSEEYNRARKEEKRFHRRKKGTFEEENLKNKTINECRAFSGKIDHSRSDFKPSSSLCKNEWTYADDIDIVASGAPAVREAFSSLVVDSK
ncbi:hypothetical protein CDAR_407531 [Caerostris darwini]|uniref:Cycloidea-like protein n=1 Tax=Caerostris darwini TaxID=1538125 RepID=A0AAV4Q1G3_9ARAC|nr:hypothetical protein CDAR_407531 [Caerostris darwini]